MLATNWIVEETVHQLIVWLNNEDFKTNYCIQFCFPQISDLAARRPHLMNVSFGGALWLTYKGNRTSDKKYCVSGTYYHQVRQTYWLLYKWHCTTKLAERSIRTQQLTIALWIVIVLVEPCAWWKWKVSCWRRMHSPPFPSAHVRRAYRFPCRNISALTWFYYNNKS